MKMLLKQISMMINCHQEKFSVLQIQWNLLIQFKKTSKTFRCKLLDACKYIVDDKVIQRFITKYVTDLSDSESEVDSNVEI